VDSVRDRRFGAVLSLLAIQLFNELKKGTIMGKEFKLILIIAAVSLVVCVAYVEFSNVVVAG